MFVVGRVESQKCPKEGFQMQAAAFQENKITCPSVTGVGTCHRMAA